tara:strand:- start:321 stop:917 length:597 start_codon:yes stop_codon:yes gene_type:complete
MSTLITNAIDTVNETSDLEFKTKGITRLKITADGALTAGDATGFGKVVQVVSDTFNYPETYYSNVWRDTPLSIALTKVAAANSVLIRVSLSFGNDSSWGNSGFRVLLNGGVIAGATGTQSGQKWAQWQGGMSYYAGHHDTAYMGGEFLDATSGTSHTYKVQMHGDNTHGHNAYLNRGYNTTSYGGGGSSTLTLMEVTA